ncbi:MAG: nucleoside monophosphate kinase [Candidatus Woesearchaeota archaeon]|jgi:adenylate kinase
MIIVITGPQGSGKGAQAKILEKEFGFKHMSTGDLLREEVKAGTPDGKEAEDYMKKGLFTPFDLNNRILKTGLEQNKGKTIILDGYPRYMAQAEYLMSITDIKCMILLKVRDEVSIERMINRRMCTANNKIYIANQITPEDINECKNLGGEIIHRPDDQPEAIKKRLLDYHNETIPVVDYFKKKGIPVLEINGEESIEDVDKEIQSKLKSLIQ